MLKSIIKAIATPERLSCYAAAVGGSSAVTYLLTH